MIASGQFDKDRIQCRPSTHQMMMYFQDLLQSRVVDPLHNKAKVIEIDTRVHFKYSTKRIMKGHLMNFENLEKDYSLLKKNDIRIEYWLYLKEETLNLDSQVRKGWKQPKTNLKVVKNK